ncbi:MAG: hypothetical protein B655_2209, partial [Methanobacterium sp. Maddingley MBC34]
MKQMRIVINPKLSFTIFLIFMALVSLNCIYAVDDAGNISSDGINNITNLTNTSNEQVNQEITQDNEYMAAGESDPSFTNEQVAKA